MKIFKKTNVSLLIFGLFFVIFDFAAANGGIMIWPPSIHVQQTDQNAIVAWNGSQELLILSTNLTKPAESGAATLLHVVPLPSQPQDIKEEDPQVFSKMVSLLNQKIAAMRTKGYDSTGGGAAMANSQSAPSVELVMQKTIGAHDITVVKVNVPNDFSNWIDGFASGKNLERKQISSNFKNGLQKYLQRGINYFAFDVLNLSDQSITVKPLVYQFDTQYFYFPLLISGISEIADSSTNINLFLVFNKDWKLPPQMWQGSGNGYYVYDGNPEIGLTNSELKGISERTASIFGSDVKVKRFAISGTLKSINKDLMIFPRLFSSNLKQGMYNNDVKILQQLLINEGFWNSAASITSYFGPATKQAVMQFQQKNSEQILKPLGLYAPTGFFGPYTRNYLNNNIFIDQGSGPSNILCGNSKCDPGETATSCSADCGTTPCITEGGSQFGPNSHCCAGLKSIPCYMPDSNGICKYTQEGCGICASCGDGSCGLGENKCNCSADCGVALNCIEEGEVFSALKSCCSGLVPRADSSGSIKCMSSTVCGNGTCDNGETLQNCFQDCAKARCLATGGTWQYVGNLPCLAFDRQQRLKGGYGCTTVIRPGYSCVCPAGKFYASYDEGCVDIICGNGNCDPGENKSNCQKDCGCVAAGITTILTGACCDGLQQLVLQKDINGTCINSDPGVNICTRCGNGSCDYGESKCNCPKDCGSNNCLLEGQGHSFFAPQNANLKCCSGLTEISTSYVIASNGSCTQALDGGTICTAKCGNGICDQNESKCNCSADCGNPVAYCGNGICDIGETEFNCSPDCAVRPKKPVIYLYPQKKENVNVKIDWAGKIIADYPNYNPLTGWNVTAYSDGRLINLADGKEYSYLFWEGDGYGGNYDMSQGFVVKGTDTKQFLQNILPKIGLTPKEYNEFIVYWYPRMKDNPYNIIHFAAEEYTSKAKLAITPQPDSTLRVFMIYKPSQTEVKVTPQTFAPFERKGFTVVEWGGSEIE